MDPTKWQELETQLRAHDWYYMMSDDHQIWRRGREQRRCLAMLAVGLAREDLQRVQRLWNQYAPITEAGPDLQFGNLFHHLDHLAREQQGV